MLTLDRQDGHILWQQEGVSGQWFADGEHLVSVFDTARDSVFAMMRDVGDLVITEYDAATGKRLGQRTHKAWLGETYVLAGGRFLVLTFEPGAPTAAMLERDDRSPGLRILRSLRLK